jgi:hypothetical protein
MTTEPEALYRQLAQIVEAIPNLSENTEQKETQQWLGRAYALISAIDPPSAIEFKFAVTNVNSNSGTVHYKGKQDVQTILYRVLAVAEMRAPAAAQGAFIPAGNAFDALATMSKLLGGAASDILMVDPYMDEKALTDFAPLAREQIALRLLADEQSQKPSLKPAVERWVAQYGTKRPLAARLAPARSLHDRLIVIDQKDVWVLTQSLNSLATRAPASIVRVDVETAALKIAVYDQMWAVARTLL